LFELLVGLGEHRSAFFERLVDVVVVQLLLERGEQRFVRDVALQGGRRLGLRIGALRVGVGLRGGILRGVPFLRTCRGLGGGGRCRCRRGGLFFLVVFVLDVVVHRQSHGLVAQLGHLVAVLVARD